jgi:2-oxoglutarate dehydrogenase E2 component (dihydrolipoamide succinyltransferase)
MTSEIKIPEVGESITEVQISEWLKAEGDTVKQNEPLAVIDSEKTTFELPAPQNGRLLKILRQAGDTVKVGEVVAQIAQESEAVTGKTEEKVSAEPSVVKDSGEAKGSEKSDLWKAKKPKKQSATPDVQKKEEKAPESDKKEEPPLEEKAEPAKDAEIKPEAPDLKQKRLAGREQEAVPMTMLRRTVAKRLVEARQTMAMLTTFNEIDMTQVQSLRKEYQEAFEKRYQVRLGFMSFFVKAAIEALKQFPQLNAEIDGDDIIYHNYFDIGVAVSTERGLVVPVLKNAERSSFAEVEKALGNFAQRAKEGELKPDELEGGTFTITNGGVFGSLFSTPIINPPQTGILGLHAIQDRPVALGGQVLVRPMMYAALTYDHRIVDGREAVQFLKRIKELIESPSRILVEI